MVIKGLLVITLAVTFVSAFQYKEESMENHLMVLAALDEDSTGFDGGMSEIQDEQEYENSDGNKNDEISGLPDLQFLTDSWWKKMCWSLVLVSVILLCAYASRCCYLVWDCCSDTYWGCCPRNECCKTCCLLKCCPRRKPKNSAAKKNRSKKMTYDYASEEEIEKFSPKKFEDQAAISFENEELRKEDFTLRTLEDSMELLPPINNNFQTSNGSEIYSLSNLSTLEKTENDSPSKCPSRKPLFTSTPLRPSAPSKVINGANAPQISTVSEKDEPLSKTRMNSTYCDENFVEEESLPQIHDGHYFNVLNIFKIGGARYEYRVARKHSEISNNSLEINPERRKANDSKFTMYSGQIESHENSIENETPLLTPTSTTLCNWPQTASSDDEQKFENVRKKRKGNKKSDKNVDQFLAANQNDFLLSDSFSNMSTAQQNNSNTNKSQRSYGLFIEEGKVGRYNPLPEAQSELWPPDHLLKMRTLGSQTVSVAASGPAIGGNEDRLHRRSRSMDVYTKSSVRPQPSRRARPVVNGDVQSQIDVTVGRRANSFDRKISVTATVESSSEHRCDTLEATPAKSTGSTPEKSSGSDIRIRNTKRPPPVPTRTTKKISLENGVIASQPPTPPPPLLIEDLSPKKYPQSLEDIFNFEKNILFGRETTL